MVQTIDGKYTGFYTGQAWVLVTPPHNTGPDTKERTQHFLGLLLTDENLWFNVTQETD